MTTTPIKTKSIKNQELNLVFAMSIKLADAVENILESHAEYRDEFLRGLKKSLKQSKEGKLIAIKSLADLN